MNEFIIWDKSDDRFWTLEELRGTGELDILVSDDFSIQLINFGIDEIFNPDGADYNQYFRREVDIETFKYIGLKDINGKNIYADCSIVEFNNSQLWNKHIGIFFYNKEKLCYQIKIIDGNRKDEIIPYDRYCSDFKIIDTIQENKLGLIKA